MCKIKNMTPHLINICGVQIPSSGVIRAAEEKKKIGTVHVDGVEVPVYYSKISTPQFPEGWKPEKGVLYIVSVLAYQAIRQYCPDISGQFLTLTDFVRDNEGRVVGANGFAVAP